ncbi:MAG: 1-deoxy-D-xylulose-5-phosphate synthase [Oligoflexia bacterium]|nr:1-deoxy-D-xylulose-5-phosphate synthase [Oligoflexia bacterium]
MKLLETINSPEDLKQLTQAQLSVYSDELREFLIQTMSKIGGHVAANLGVVELTTALHYVFDTPHDKIVWDVGHQCYAHKIITGRRDKFHTIRQDGGLSGFTKISESPYDVFGAGHSSTSVSAGLGVAEGEWQNGTDNQVVSIIGDGALTAGIAYEALNHAGHLRRPNYIVIFNDNEMSISENVGALAQFFGKRVNSSLYNNMRAEIKTALKSVSTREMNVFEKVKLLSHVVKDLFSTSSFFEALGFRYVGPIDGHNVPELISTLNSVKELSRGSMDNARANFGVLGFEVDPPILVHVKTKKGLGLKTAEQRPGDFHGVTGFCMNTGEPTKKPAQAPTYTSIFSQTLCRLAESDSKIVAVTAAMADGTGLGKFQKQYPERFYDVGIAEQHAVTFSGAMSLSGLRPAVAIYSTFLQRAYDQVIHDVAIQNIPLALFLDRGGLVGADGPTHHGVFDMSFLRCIPGAHIMAPKDENELQHMVYTALYCEKLASVRFPRGEGYGVALDSKLQMLPLGKCEKLINHIKPEVIIWAAGSCVYPALEAGKELQAMGVACEVVNARFIKPLDIEVLLKDASRAQLIVSVEENAVIGGLGSAILEGLATHQVMIPVLNLGLPDEFIEHGSLGRLRTYCHIDQKSIVNDTLKRLEKISNRKVKQPILEKETHEAPAVTH